MVQLIQVIANGSNAVNVSNLPSSTYPSSTVWMQTLSYASLAFSVLAAFGAVMGKQWINSYKTTRGRGSLEDRGLERQRKLEGLEYWNLRTVLGALLVLLQISLLLFGLSLSANMFRQTIAVSSVIIGTTAFGMIFYLTTILVSVLSPYSPCQSPGSKIIGTIFKDFLPVRSISPNDSWRAVRWILETSTNPDFVSAAAAMVSQVDWPKDVDVGTICERLRDTFTASSDKLECVKGIAHLWAESVGFNRGDTQIGSKVRNRLIHDAFAAGRYAWEQFVVTEETDTQRRKMHKDDARTSLRMVMVYAGQKKFGEYWKFSPPDHNPIWYGDLEWHQSDGQPPSCDRFDWLIGYLAKVKDETTDTLLASSTMHGLGSSDTYLTKLEDETTHALLALSTMHGLGSSDKRASLIRSLIHFLHSKRSRVREAAVRVIVRAGRNDLTNITSDLGVHPLLDSFFRALFTATLMPSPFYDDRNSHCFHLVFALAANKEWDRRLSEPLDVERCISLVDSILSRPKISFYLVGILLCIDPSGKNRSLNPRWTRWPELMSKAWDGLGHFDLSEQDNKCCIDFLPVLIEAVRKIFPDPNNSHPTLEQRGVQILAANVNFCLGYWRRTMGQGDESPINAVLPAVQSLYDDLCRMKDQETVRLAINVYVRVYSPFYRSHGLCIDVFQYRSKVVTIRYLLEPDGT